MKIQLSEHEAALLRANFDAHWYLVHYADVKAAGVDPWLHFEKHGYTEGRLPCDLPASAYLAANKWPLSALSLKQLGDYAIGNDLNSALAGYLLSMHWLATKQWHKAARCLPALDSCYLLSLLLNQTGPVVLFGLLNDKSSLEPYSRYCTSSKVDDACSSGFTAAAAFIRQIFYCTESKRASLVDAYWRSLQPPLSKEQGFWTKLRQMATGEKAAVTVVMPLLNAEARLPSLFLNLLQSDGVIAEIIVVVAVSSDNTLSIAQDWALSHKNIKILHTPDIYTLDQARALGVAAANTPMLLFHDQELWCSTARLDFMLKSIAHQPKAQVVLTRVLRVSGDLLPECHLPEMINDALDMQAVLVRSELLQKLKRYASTGELSTARVATLVMASGKSAKVVAAPKGYLAVRYTLNTEFSAAIQDFVQLHQAEVSNLNQPVMTKSGKTSLLQLQDLDRVSYAGQLEHINRTALYYFEDQGLHYDFLWRPKTQSNKLFVFFSGDAMRKKYNPPVFQRQSWASRVPGHCLFISDPMLYIDSSLGLAWYSGTELQDPLLRIAELIQQVVADLGLSLADVVAYGSSGGGYAALRLSLVLPDIAVICINPQTDITEYETRGVEKYLRLCWQGIGRAEAKTRFAARFSLLPAAEQKKFNHRRIIYVQNVMDTHHFEEHFKPFCEAVGIAPVSSHTQYISVILFSHPDGHAKAETDEVFKQAIDYVMRPSSE